MREEPGGEEGKRGGGGPLPPAKTNLGLLVLWIRLQCEPSQAQSTLWTTCPSLQCQGTKSLYIGNTTTSSCNRTTCAYAGYNNQTIFTTLTSLSTCPVSGNPPAPQSPPTSDGNIYVPKFSLQGQSWSFILMFIHLVLLYLHLT
ncbi:hypothetical protein RHMOL_Rhmol11G0283200 [Rhododendron molle]|uniref:Uncharacterized protein n=1 Tax=Rhododendron molle TaxID=49168 RepID=A0ACC0LY20_RHOML|nr:hypothetical protein RHMOL_Rhmol11G0283200 [Rhododendron molle]